jgi:hypothetical protein
MEYSSRRTVLASEEVFWLKGAGTNLDREIFYSNSQLIPSGYVLNSHFPHTEWQSQTCEWRRAYW